MSLNEFQPIDLRCVGCGNIMTQPPILEVPPVNLCRIYFYPEAKWSAGKCPRCTVQAEKVKQTEKALDPIKLSKRKMKGK